MSRWLKGEPVWTGGRKRGRKQFRYQDGAAFQFGPDGACIVITVSSSFVFDLSAPWWLAWLIPAPLKRKLLRAAGIHDQGRGDPTWTLWFGDLLFMDALRADGVPTWQAEFVWHLVRSNNNRS